MGYGLGIYCEREVFYQEKLIEELNLKFQGEGEYTSFTLKAGYYFFGDYRIYHKKSVFYQICQLIDSDFYEYFATLDYVEDLGEWIDKGLNLNWQNLIAAKNSLEHFLKEIKSIDIEKLFHDLSKKVDSFRLDSFKNYFLSSNEGIMDDLRKCHYYIKLFEKYGAKEILFIYD